MKKQVIHLYNKFFPKRTYSVQGENIGISLSPFYTPIIASFSIEKYIIETKNGYVCHNTTFMFLTVSAHNAINFDINNNNDNKVYTLHFPISPATTDIIDSIKKETIKLRQYLAKNIHRKHTDLYGNEILLAHGIIDSHEDEIRYLTQVFNLI